MNIQSAHANNKRLLKKYVPEEVTLDCIHSTESVFQEGELNGKGTLCQLWEQKKPVQQRSRKEPLAIWLLYLLLSMCSN